MKDKIFNGHKNWNHWNVSLWINNDESLYGDIQYLLRLGNSKDIVAVRMLETLSNYGITQTPDGAPYSKSSIRAAMRGM